MKAIIKDEQKCESTLDEKNIKLGILKEQLEQNQGEVVTAENNRDKACKTVEQDQKDLDQVSLFLFQYAYFRAFRF